MITRRDFLKVTAAGGALASLGSVTEAKAAMKSAVPDEGFCHEGARKIPVIAEVDLVVAGGSSRAIAAAVAAAISLRNTFSIFPPSANVFKEH